LNVDLLEGSNLIDFGNRSYYIYIQTNILDSGVEYVNGMFGGNHPNSFDSIDGGEWLWQNERLFTNYTLAYLFRRGAYE
jgi:hypothetical protein